MASTPPLWGVHAAVPRTGEASPSVVEKPFREVGNGDSPSVFAQHISRSHEKPCKSQTHPYCGPSMIMTATYMYHMIFLYKTHELPKKTEHNFLELTYVILLITDHPKCDSLSRNSMDFSDALISIAPDEAAFKKCTSGDSCVMDSNCNQIHLTNKVP